MVTADYIRHFYRGLASVPAWAAPDENHVLGTTQLVKSVTYEPDRVRYVTALPGGKDVLRLTKKPVRVTSGTVALIKGQAQNGFDAMPIRNGGFAVRLLRGSGTEVTIDLP